MSGFATLCRAEKCEAVVPAIMDGHQAHVGTLFCRKRWARSTGPYDNAHSKDLIMVTNAICGLLLIPLQLVIGLVKFLNQPLLEILCGSTKSRERDADQRALDRRDCSRSRA